VGRTSVRVRIPPQRGSVDRRRLSRNPYGTPPSAWP
jgi:hypothetical protein